MSVRFSLRFVFPACNAVTADISVKYGWNERAACALSHFARTEQTTQKAFSIQFNPWINWRRKTFSIEREPMLLLLLVRTFRLWSFSLQHIFLYRSISPEQSKHFFFETADFELFLWYFFFFILTVFSNAVAVLFINTSANEKQKWSEKKTPINLFINMHVCMAVEVRIGCFFVVVIRFTYLCSTHM